MASAIHREPSMDSAVSNSQRGRDEPVSVRSRRRILAQFQRQFGEHGALDFVNVVVLCCRDSRASREIITISMIRLRWYRLASEPRLIHAHVPMPLAALAAWAQTSGAGLTHYHWFLSSGTWFKIMANLIVSDAIARNATGRPL